MQPPCKSPLSLPASHCPQPPLPLPCVELLQRTGRAHVDSWHVLGDEWWWSGHRQRSLISDAFWCAACEITNNGHCPPTQAPPEGRVTSLPWSWLLQILWCAGEGCEGGWSVGLAQDGRCSKVAAGDPAVTTSNLSLSCFRNRQWMCAPYQESSAFHGSSVSPGSPPAGWGDLSPPSRTPAPKGPICGSNHSFPRVGSPLPHIFPLFLWVPAQWHRFQCCCFPSLPTWLPVYLS